MAESMIESSSGGSSAGMGQQPQLMASQSNSGGGSGSSHMNPIIPVLSADMDSQHPPPPRPSSMQQQHTTGTTTDDSLLISEGPSESKRRKHDSGIATSNEKLELRLGGILCCAVCLDLPKTAMYQVLILNPFKQIGNTYFTI